MYTSYDWYIYIYMYTTMCSHEQNIQLCTRTNKQLIDRMSTSLIQRSTFTLKWCKFQSTREFNRFIVDMYKLPFTCDLNPLTLNC